MMAAVRDLRRILGDTFTYGDASAAGVGDKRLYRLRDSGEIIALGGGAVTYEPTRKLLAERALRIYLDISVDTLVLRLRRSPTIRPVVGTAPTEARVRELLSAREPFYREAEIIVTGPRRTKMTFVREILDRIDEYKRSSQSVS